MEVNQCTAKSYSASKHSQGRAADILCGLSPAWSIIRADYEIIECIGRGCNGPVVKARHLHSGIEVAIKMISGIRRTDYTLKKAYREVALLQQLSALGGDRHVSKLLDVIGSPKNATIAECSELFIVMEYGALNMKTTLKEKQIHNFSEADAIRLLYRLLCSLNFIHKAGVIHRDVKPANILVSSDDVKLCDFGLSRQDPQVADPHEVPKTRRDRKMLSRRLVAGAEARKKKRRSLSNHVSTRIYRAPEIILQERHYFQSMDLWSLGCLISEVIFATDDYKKYGTINKDNNYLFPGTSCFPLSPSPTLPYGSVGEKDQTQVILRTLGALNEEDFSFISDSRTFDYLDDHYCEDSRIKFEKEMPFSHPSLISMMKSLLQFNPYFRKSAADLLTLSMFDECREPELEKGPSAQVQILGDNEDDYDYRRCLDLNFTEADYLKELKAEIDKVKAANQKLFCEERNVKQ